MNNLTLTKSFSRHFVNVAKAAKVKRLIDKVTSVDMEIIREHARTYFKKHTRETSLIYEVYMDGRGEERIASREPGDDPPENVLARGIASCFTRGRYVVPEQEVIRLSFDFEPEKKLDLIRVKQLTYERRD